MKTLITFLFLTWMTTRLLAQGTVLWNESLHGPLGNAPETATSLGVLGLGTNSIFGMSEAIPIGQSWGVQSDFFEFHVPVGWQVSGLYYVANRPTWVWLGDPTFANQFGFLSDPTNGDLLPQLGLGSLESGNYGSYVLNRDLQSIPTTVSYRLDFIVTAVPEPGTWALLGLGSALFWCAARRRRKS
jgi:hypothetical protein